MAPPLGRLVIYTKRVEEMAQFYCGHFGFSILRLEDDRIVELRPKNGGTSILLHPATSKQKEGQALVKLVFDVEDVSAFCETSKTLGLEFGKVHQANGYAFANAKDPAGNSVQVTSRPL